MRIALNLSSEPFRRDRPMVAASVATGVLLIGLLALLVFLAVEERGQATEARQEIAALRKDAAALNAEQARLAGLLQRPDNLAVLDRVLFINTLAVQEGHQLDEGFFGRGRACCPTMCGWCRSGRRWTRGTRSS